MMVPPFNPIVRIVSRPDVPIIIFYVKKQLRRYAYAGIAVHFALGGVLTYLLSESAKLEDAEAAAVA